MPEKVFCHSGCMTALAGKIEAIALGTKGEVHFKKAVSRKRAHIV